jgi:hypothetical protein
VGLPNCPRRSTLRGMRRSRQVLVGLAGLQMIYAIHQPQLVAQTHVGAA